VLIQDELLMNDPKKDISKLQDEMDKAREDASQRGESLKPSKSLGFDAVLMGCLLYLAYRSAWQVS